MDPNEGAEYADLVRNFENRRALDSQALSNTPLPSTGRPERLSIVAQLVRLDLEYGWSQGRPRALATYLTDYPELLADRSALTQLANDEYCYRLEAGDNPDPADYATQFGVLLDNPGETPAVIGHSTVQFPKLRGQSSPQLARYPYVGETFAEFEILNELGRGTFARVYLARQAGLAGRTVALKLTTVPSVESQTLAQLQHPNIVPIYSVHEANGLYAVCMPYYGSTTLADVVGTLSHSQKLPGSGRYFLSALASGRPPSSQSNAPLYDSTTDTDFNVQALLGAEEALARLAKASYVEAVVWLIARLADGLAHAHARNIIHRDLKPANILLTNDGQPMLLDFNLAESSQFSPHAGGTLPYMAPEHLLAYQDKPGGAVDARSDLYSLGLIAYELLAGCPPFPIPSGPVRQALPQMVAMRVAGPPDVRQFNSAVSPAVAAIVRTCLAPRPEDRYASATDLRDDLDAHLDHRQLKVAPNPSLVENSRKWVRRHPKLAAALPIAVVATTIVLVLTLVLYKVDRRQNINLAREQARQFHELRNQLDFRSNSDSLKQGYLTESIALGKAALAPYGVFDDPAWRERPAVTRLPAEEQNDLIRSVRRILFLMTRTAQLTDSPEAAAFQSQLANTGLADEESAKSQAELLSEQAIDHLDNNRTNEAESLLSRAVELAPESTFVRFQRGICLGRLGKHNAAIAEFDVCIAIDSGNVIALQNRASAFRSAFRWTDAITDYSILSELQPDQSRWLMERGYCRTQTGEYLLALGDLTAAIDSKTAPSRCYLYRSKVYAKLNQSAEATSDLVRMVKASPTDALDYRFRALIRYNNDPEGAVIDLRAALELDPRMIELSLILAGVLSDKLGRHAEAAKVLDPVVARNPTLVAYRSARAISFARAGDRTSAHADAKAVLANHPTPLIIYQLAGVYAQTSKQVDADKTNALALMAKAFQLRGSLIDQVANDPDLGNMREDPEFLRLVATTKKLRDRQSKPK